MQQVNPIAPESIKDMTPGDREALLEGIRERRLEPIRIYDRLTLMKAEARKEDLEKQWTKALEMFGKDLLRVDKAIDSLEKRTIKLRAIELEIETL